MEGSSGFRLGFLDFVVEAILFRVPVKSNGCSASGGRGCRIFGATMTSAWGERMENGCFAGSWGVGSICVTLMTAVEVGDKYMVIGWRVVTARIWAIRLISRKFE